MEHASDTLAMSVDAAESSSSAPIDLSQLSIKRNVYEPDTLSDLGLKDYEIKEDDSLELEDAELQKFEEGYVRVAEYGIYSPDHQEYGKFTVWYIDKDKLGRDFYWLMDSFHSETEFLASQLFDGQGNFKRKSLTEGTGVWGSEVDGSPICYLESIKIGEEYRGKGIGSWALEKMWAIRENLPITGLEDVKFLFTLPAPTPEELEKYKQSQIADPAESNRIYSQNWDFIVNTRINPFLRRVGYRRVGTTRLFCCARDPLHPSKQIGPDQDANEFIPTRAEHFERIDDDQDALNALFARLKEYGAP